MSVTTHFNTRMRSVLAGAAALGAAALSASPAAAQGFSVTIGGPPPPRYYAPPPPAYYAPPPPYGYYAPRPRCWREPVDVWNGWTYERRMRRVCR